MAKAAAKKEPPTTIADQKAKTKRSASAMQRYQSLQEDIGKVTFDSVNPEYRSKYASLPYLLQKVMPSVHKHGFAITVTSSAETGIVTTLCDGVEGFSVASFNVPWPETRDPQKLGSAITYARRYGLCCVLNLCVDKDDDGNAASGKSTPAVEKASPPVSKGLHKTPTKGNRSTKKPGAQYKLPLDDEIPF